MLKVFVAKWDGSEPFQFTVDPLDMVHTLECRLWEVFPNRISLVYGEHVLDSRSTLADAGVVDGSTLTLVRGAPLSLYALTSSVDRTVKIWSVDSGTCLGTLKGHGGCVSSAVFSTDGTWVLTGSEDFTAKLWSTADWHCIRTFMGHTDFVNSAALSTDGMWALTASKDKTAKIWSTSSGECIHALREHSGQLLSALFSRDGLSALTASEDMTVRVWSTQHGTCSRTFPHQRAVRSAIFSRDGSLVLTSSRENATLWNKESGARMYTFIPHVEARGIAAKIWSAAFSADASSVLIYAEKIAKLWDIETGACTETSATLSLESEHREWCTSADASPGGIRPCSFNSDGSKKLIATGSNTLLYDMEENVLHTLVGHARLVLSVAFSPPGVFIGTRTWSADNAAPQTSQLSSASVGSSSVVACSWDGSTVMDGAGDTRAKGQKLEQNYCLTLLGALGLKKGIC